MRAISLTMALACVPVDDPIPTAVDAVASFTCGPRDGWPRGHHEAVLSTDTETITLAFTVE